jgi:class 3 adenylate cyclase/tetratricopeptide (TPR) repeat protein
MSHLCARQYLAALDASRANCLVGRAAREWRSIVIDRPAGTGHAFDGPPKPRSVVMEITEWLSSLGLGAYAQAFRDNHIDAETLPSLTMDDLREMGIASVGHRRRILAGIASLAKVEAGPAAALGDEALTGERRQVTVLFADIAGFTTLSTELDAEQVHALLSAFFEQVDRIIADFGGRIDKHIGDCAMAVFGAPVAHSDDVRRAVASALAIHAAMGQVSEAAGRVIAAHVGIASGEVVASRTGSSRYTEYTVTGETVNLASRLTGLARDGETIASADIVATLGESVDAAFGGSQPIKGLAAPVDVWRIRALEDAAPGDRPLVGRRTELAQCVAALRAARDSEAGAILYVRGEPGIGKSSLAAAALREADRLGFTGVRAAVFDFGTGLDRDPLRVLALALLGVLTALSPTPDALAAFAAAERLGDSEVLALKDLAGVQLSPGERGLLDATTPGARVAARGEALAGLAIAAGRRAPLLVVVEDVHWADAVTLQGLAAMARAAGSAGRTVTMMTVRIEGDPRATLEPLMSGPPLVLIELGRLPDEDARTLAAGLLDTSNTLIEQCIARAGGNPLFLEQLVRHASTGGLASAIPGSIRSVVAAEIDRLNRSEKGALQAAAVLGNQFSLDALRHMLARPEWDPGALIGNRLVVAEKDALQFAHALIRDGAYASILNTDRRRLHGAAAAWFSGRDSVLHAEHLARAEDPAAVAAYLAAAEEQVAHYRVEEGLALLERAGGLAAEPAERFTVMMRQGDLLTELGRSAEAITAYDRALEAAPDEVASAMARLGKAGVLRLLDRNHDALALLAEAEPVFLAADRFADLSRLAHLRGNLYYPLGQTAACQEAHEHALVYAERSGSVELKARALGGLGDAAFARKRLNTSGRLFAQCVELAREHGFGRIEVANAVMLAAHCDDAQVSLAGVERAIAMAAAAHQPRAELTGHQVAMGLHIFRARPEAVAANFERAQDIVRRIGAPRSAAYNIACMAEAHRQLGDRARAAAMHEEAVALAREFGMSHTGAIILGLRALAAHDNPELRCASLAEGERVLAQPTVALNALWFYTFAIESCLLARDWSEARRFSDGFSASFPDERIPMIEFLVDRGRLLAALGGSGPSEPLLQALTRCREAGRRVGYTLFVTLLDRALDPAGSPGSAAR